MPSRPESNPLGVFSGTAVALLCLAYAGVLAVGLLTLPSPEHPIQQPWFAAMEILILAIAPAMVALAVALHAWAGRARRPVALLAVCFMSMTAALTCAVHFSILTLGRHPVFTHEPWARRVFGFEWPSVAYALDILAWDVLFPLAAWCMGAVLQGPGLARTARQLLYASAALALLGLVGVPLSDMQVRNIGILGYVVLFPIAAGVMAALFRRKGGEREA